MNKALKHLIVAGGRDFQDKTLCLMAVYGLINQYPDHTFVIVSGGARGADSLGEWVADELKLRMLRIPADWDQYGKQAGRIRNCEMADVADLLLAFWDGKSFGTKHMIEEAKFRSIPTQVIFYQSEENNEETQSNTP